MTNAVSDLLYTPGLKNNPVRKLDQSQLFGKFLNYWFDNNIYVHIILGSNITLFSINYLLLCNSCNR